MLDVAVAYNRFKFLGDEFLTWLWFIIENDQTFIRNWDSDFVSLKIGNRIALENRTNDGVERITIKGDIAGLDEGFLALSKGAMVSELNMVYKTGENESAFTVKGESLNISSLNTPTTGAPQTPKDVEGCVIEKAYHYDQVITLLQNLYTHFIKLRISNDWNNKHLTAIKKWIKSA
jgi:hypothetical protein